MGQIRVVLAARGATTLRHLAAAFDLADEILEGRPVLLAFDEWRAALCALGVRHLPWDQSDWLGLFRAFAGAPLEHCMR